MTEDEKVGWHHQLNGHEFEHTPGDSEGKGRQVCFSSGAAKSWATNHLATQQQQQHSLQMNHPRS